MVLEVGLILAVFVASQNLFESLRGVSTRTSQLSAQLRKSTKDLLMASHIHEECRTFG